MSAIAQEIASQPRCWERAARVASAGGPFPLPGQRVAVIGCGTSLFIARSFAVAREAAGEGVTDAFPASEFPASRTYDCVLAISRSGTTTEVLRALGSIDRSTPTIGITAVADAPLASAVASPLVLDFADERSVVQTRFATTTLAYLRTRIGQELEATIRDAREALGAPLPVTDRPRDHFVFLGHGWSVGLAEEAALKLREAAGLSSEAYPAMEYRHGPISLAGPTSLVWILGSPEPGIEADVEATGATLRTGTLDPMAELVMAQRLAVELAEARGRDPDRPPHLTRSVVLQPPEPIGRGAGT